MDTVFSHCRTYRYTLWRTWDALFPAHKYVNFICLNPSTADETKDDNTIRKCIKFAKSWGYDGLCVTNLFAFRSTDRSVLPKIEDPVGPENDFYIRLVAENAALIIAAWSQDGGLLQRSAAVRSLISKPMHYLRKSAEPWHPLYLPDVSKPIEWKEVME